MAVTTIHCRSVKEQVIYQQNAVTHQYTSFVALHSTICNYIYLIVLNSNLYNHMI